MEDSGKLLLRLTCAGLMLFHGIAKVIHGAGFLGGALAAYHLPAFIGWGVYAGEVIAPLFMILGLWTRIASLVVMFDIAMAVFLVAHRNAFALSRSGAWGLETEAFFFLTALVVFLVGAGKFRLTRGEGILA
jgi:putative oxidoreductase